MQPDDDDDEPIRQSLTYICWNAYGLCFCLLLNPEKCNPAWYVLDQTQLEVLFEPPGELVPPGQIWQIAEPAESENAPAWHGAHSTAPMEGENVPGLHGVHAVCPSEPA